MNVEKKMRWKNIVLGVALLITAPCVAQEHNVPAHKDIKYGTHARNAFDMWPAKLDKPAPLVFFSHAGSFVGTGVPNDARGF